MTMKRSGRDSGNPVNASSSLVYLCKGVVIVPSQASGNLERDVRDDPRVGWNGPAGNFAGRVLLAMPDCGVNTVINDSNLVAICCGKKGDALELRLSCQRART
jgi:hypothetical protein